jgi:hypothetical protein
MTAQLVLGGLEALFCTSILGWTSAGIIQRFSLRGMALNLMAWTLALVLFISLTVLVLGLAGLLNPHIITALCAVLGIVNTKHLTISLVELGSLIQSRLTSIRRQAATSPVYSILMLTGVAVVTLRSLLHSLLFPPYVYDTLTYHLPRVAEWIQSGEIQAFETPVVRTAWPAGFELIQTWCGIFFHHDLIIEWAGAPFLLLSMLAVYLVSTALGLSKKLSFAAALLYAMTPAVLMHSVGCKNDLPIAALYLSIVSLFFMLADERIKQSDCALLIAAAGSLAIGIKPTMLFLSPGLIVLLLILSARNNWKPGKWFDGWFKRNDIILGLLGMLLLAGYWYARNAHLYSNPFYPTEVTLFGIHFEGAHGNEGQQGGFSIDALTTNLGELAGKRFFEAHGDYTPDLTFISGWGWTAAGLGLVSLAWMLCSHAKLRLLASVFGFSLLTLLGSVAPDPWNMRFTLWFPALFCFAVMLAWQTLKSPACRVAFSTLILASATANVLDSLDSGIDPFVREEVLEEKLLERSALRMEPEPIRNAMACVPSSEELGYFSHANCRTYPLYGPAWERTPVYLALTSDTPIFKQMDDAGVRYLFFIECDNDWLKLADHEVVSGKLSTPYPGLYKRNDHD